MLPSVRRFTETLRGLERWLLPASCLLCGESVPEREDDPLICGMCRTRWRPVPHPVCTRCGQPTIANVECLLCPAWPVGLDRARSAVWLDASARRAVHQLKYDGWWRTADVMADVMRQLEPLTPGVSLIPVPLGRGRLRARGYNQSERIAAALAARLDLPVRAELLVRVRDTQTQTRLAPEERHANVHGAFAARPAAGIRAVLVDDVFTTGATLAAAAAALAEAGALSVDAVTFARAMPPVTNLGDM